MADPVKAEQLREIGRIYGAPNGHLGRTPEARAKAAAKTRAAHLSWCPEEYWPLNAKLKRDGYRLADRKRMVAEEIAAVEARAVQTERARIAALTPHERALERLANGARLVAKPDLRRAGPAMTLGGVAPEAM